MGGKLAAGDGFSGPLHDLLRHVEPPPVQALLPHRTAGVGLAGLKEYQLTGGKAEGLPRDGHLPAPPIHGSNDIIGVKMLRKALVDALKETCLHSQLRIVVHAPQFLFHRALLCLRWKQYSTSRRLFLA